MREPSPSIRTTDGAFRASSTLASFASWRRCLTVVAHDLLGEADRSPDVLLLFAAREFHDDATDLLAETQRAIRPGHLVATFGSGCIGSARELERAPGLAALALWLPDTQVTIRHIAQADVRLGTPRIPPADGYLLFTDPFRIDVDSLLAEIAEAAPGVPVIGGITGGQDREQHTFLAIDDMPVQHGAVLVGLHGLDLVPIVSQACEPIGEPWSVTEAEGNAILTISGRPAIDVLIETVAALSPHEQREARRHLLVGFALDEYRDEFARGDFLIRDVLGMDHARAAIRVGYLPRPGQTIQFQMRDPVTADIDLHQHLLETRASLGTRAPLAAVLSSCAGRGSGLFGRSDHDASAVHAAFGGLPLAGFSSLGEIVGDGGRPVLHSYSAALGLLVPREGSTAIADRTR